MLTSETPKINQDRATKPSVNRVSTWAEFQAQSRPLEDAVLWQRAMPKSVRDWLDQIPDAHLPTGRFRLASVEIGACLEEIFAEVGIANHPALSWLRQDAERLASLVAKMHDVSTVRLRVEAVFDNACRKFHIDNVVARLICTYRGPGTQLSICQGDSGEIKTVPTGVPVLLKGKQWPQANDVRLHHRSPPIEGTGVSRLVLVLDPVHEDDEIGTSYDRGFEPN